MIKKIRKLRGNQSGVAMVEFALILPLLLLIVFIIIEFGLILYNQQVITNASREGARAGIVAGLDRPTASLQEAENVAEDYCDGYLITFGATKSCSANATDNGISFGDELTVNVTFPYNYFVLDVPLFFGDWSSEFVLHAKATMNYE